MNRILLALALAPLLLILFGCDDLGSCQDPLKGRKPVASGNGQVMYVGQALMVKACATGCHQSTAKHEQRNGAPAGMNFDITSLDAKTMTADAMSGLRERQRKVFDLRYDIWSQIEDDFMPPSGVGKGFKQAEIGDAVTFSGGKCTRGETYAPFSNSATRAELRSWLACGAPIVELSDTSITTPKAGTVGDQFPFCPPPVSMNPSIEDVWNILFKPSCVDGCHTTNGGIYSKFDLSSPEIAYNSLLGGDKKGAPLITPCAAYTSYVVPNMPEASYIYAIIGGAGTAPACDKMPLGGEYPPAATSDVLKNWIATGAPPPGSMGGGTGDAGM